MSREEKKAEEQLKALLRLPANKRCINCDSLGPQYVVSAFNVFVCTSCSGVHRQFGHRVKGVSMSTFKADEVTALKESGNEKFAAFFLSKWTSAALPKPVEREAQRIHAWIAAVYQDRRFYAEPAGWAPSGGGGTPSRSAAGSTTASEAGEPSMRPLHEVLGSDTPKLHVQHSGSLQPLERSVSAASSSAGAATPPRSATAPPPSAGAAAARGLNLLDASSPKSAKSAPLAAPPAAWDPFAASSPTAAAGPAAQPSPPPPAAAPAGWASFGDAPGPQQQQQQVAAAAPAAAPAAEGTSAGGWEAFGDSQPAAAAAPAAAGVKSGAAAPVAVPAVPAAPAAGVSTSASSSPGKQPPPQPKQPVRSTSRPEVPMDVFYPEFEQIRATGMLPNGQPVPLPAFRPSYAGLAPRPGAGPAAVGPHPGYGHPAGAPGQQRPAGAYGGAGYVGAAPPRPTIAIPPAPLHPGGYYPGAPSPGGYYHAAPSPNLYSSPSVYSPGSLPSPAGSAFSAGSQPGAAPSNGGYGGGPLPGCPPDLRSSTGSLGELLPGSAAPTPAGAAAAAHDPFAGLAPGLRAALPAAPAGGGKWGAGAPPPTPAGGPPFANGGSAPPPAFPPAGPFAGAPAPSPAGLPPATAAASATLFGRAPSLTGYDLSAPAAPKPQPTGNPFA